MKLILEENGKQRAFNLGDGVLTVGSGEGARLRLEDPDVADVHFELMIEGDSATLTPRRGMLPPRIGNTEIKGPRKLAPGERIELSGVALWFEDENAERATPVGKPTARRKRVAQPGRHRSVVQRGKPRVQRGLPPGLLIVLLLAVVAVVGALGKRAFESQAEAGASPVWATIRTAEEMIAESRLEEARRRLDDIPAAAEIEPDQRDRITELRTEIERAQDAAMVGVSNLAGTQYMEVLLKRYESRWLVGDPDPAKVRFFMKRLAEFRRRWPQHPDMDWVARQESRFRGSVDLTAPPTWEDVEWEIKHIREQHVRQYSHAYALLDEFDERATGEEKSLARQLRLEMDIERHDYFKDRLYQADHEYNEKDDPAQAVWWLLNLTIYIGDEALARQAAEYLVKIPKLKMHLEAYARQYPERYELVLQHPLVREKALELGLE